jgi:hypothetical protein
MFESHQIKSNYRALRNNILDTYGTPVLHQTIAPLFLPAKMFSHSHEHSMYNRLLWLFPTYLVSWTATAAGQNFGFEPNFH